MKSALITGGNAGIGRAIARRLSADGFGVAICGRTEKTLSEAAEEIEGDGGTVFAARCDVGDPGAVKSFVAAVAERFGSINALINNAGLAGVTPLGEGRDDARWSAILRANLDGPYYFTAETLSHMPDGGRIVNISSILGRFGVPGYAAYSTSKHGVIGLTRTTALEVAGRRITANAICPGWVETDMARQGMEAGARGQDIDYEEFREQALEDVPLGAMIDPSEVAALVAFLVSPEAASITGQAYNLDGGQTMD